MSSMWKSLLNNTQRAKIFRACLMNWSNYETKLNSVKGEQHSFYQHENYRKQIAILVSSILGRAFAKCRIFEKHFLVVTCYIICAQQHNLFQLVFISYIYCLSFALEYTGIRLLQLAGQLDLEVSDQDCLREDELSRSGSISQPPSSPYLTPLD